MLRAFIAEEILALSTPPERAATIAGDLVEEARARGLAWFCAALAGVSLAMFARGFGLARGLTLRLLAVGLAGWFAVYVLVRVAGAALGLEPLLIPIDDPAALPPATLAYLGGTLMLSSFVTGLAFGFRPARNGSSPVMPLAMFWSTTAVVAPLADAWAGTATWFCTMIYLLGVPACYVLPLLAGGVAARRGAARRRSSAAGGALP
ncbi:MAG TPA: hypothetical protein VF329_05015 [Gammaproteobacteria bacterium]